VAVRILQGDCRALLRSLPDESVDCCVTSPPYWGLRSYLPDDHPDKHLEIGSEPTLQDWVNTMVEVFREVRRVLKPDGTLWLNLGDAYAGSRCGGDSHPEKSTLNGKQTNHAHQAFTADHKNASAEAKARKRRMTASARRDDHPVPRSDVAVAGLKPKDMMGQPWRVAFALQADGWWLRQEIIWHKPNPMPESARDRCTKAHEHVFLLSKSERYFYNFQAMQEPVNGTANARRAITSANWATGDEPHTASAHNVAQKHRKTTGVGFGHGFDKTPKPRVTGMNPKAAAATASTPGAYAQGKSEKLGRGPGWRARQNESFTDAISGDVVDTRNPRSVWTIPTYPFKGAHFATFPPDLAERCVTAGCPPGGTVLDPFGGSGTVGMVADGLQMHAVLLELDSRSVGMARDRITDDAPLFAEVHT
jgi:DNA modification methylase